MMSLLLIPLHCVERHGDSPYEDVRDRERGYEVVCRLSDLSVHNEADEDQQVAEGGDDDADGQTDDDEDGHEGSERSGPALRTTRTIADGNYKGREREQRKRVCVCILSGKKVFRGREFSIF